ncbi:hypothetical protein KM914_21095 [Virgibacillus pantothenticus]|uniref:hypothetical protein n=1 Tax=Virgibacillus pantothenticus TaxID=1473 RepID=UPI001C21D3B1|nr:hypothetical protein [Virgibacillus pantothenticus]MBU8568865.1 hypothetical protein [Virgibacillus pantothenticus]MBU8601897.1 hypothetical protein [Virgibacillus pantothenticus]MBU8636010.1 hypothetical protein [Virgibacillus pantothenticus]MBU8644756.1 hypothetical protein [Virgibacillus pantothenticus]MBU8647960.1 hypothetical protein [Virgibacillus pantothenticus]
MKKYLLIIFASLLILPACGGADKEYKDQLKEAEKKLEESKEDTERLEEISEQIDGTSDLIEETQEEMGFEDEDEEDNSNDLNEVDELDENEARELLEYGVLGEEDSLIDLVISDGEIKAHVEIGDNNIFDDKSLLAETIYSSAGDILLEYEGWEVLTIEFTDIGEVSLHRNEKETNEFDMDYFPLEKIIGQLGND